MQTITKLIIALLLLICTQLKAQEFQGVATYKSHMKFNQDLKMEGIDDQMKKNIREQLSKQFQKEYTLTFKGHESTYQVVEELAKPAPQNAIVFQIQESNDVYYKNLKENRYTNEVDIMGKAFLVKDTLKTKKWQLVNETKNIGRYTCYKAIYTYEVEEETIKESKLTKEKKQKTVTAWYTPQVPINNGPKHYYGLPGLILEIHDGKYNLICSKIVINPKESVEIKEPKNGKVVDQAEFDAIQDKKHKEMMERFHNNRSNDGSVHTIRIGG